MRYGTNVRHFVRLRDVGLATLISIVGCGLAVRGTDESTAESPNPAEDPDAATPTLDAPSSGPSSTSGSEERDSGASVKIDPTTFLSPSNPSSALTLARGSRYTIAAFDDAARILYTIDGATPSSTSASANGVVDVDLPASATLKWMVAGDSEVHSFAAMVDTTKQKELGAVIESFQFDATKKPVIIVGPGASVDARLNLQVWSQSTCPGCIVQVTYGFATPVGCFLSKVVGNYANASNDIRFKITAPAAPGDYSLRVNITEEYNCADALSKHALSTNEIGRVRVQ